MAGKIYYSFCGFCGWFCHGKQTKICYDCQKAEWEINWIPMPGKRSNYMKKVMHCANYPFDAGRTAIFKNDNERLNCGALGLAGEVGEVVEIIKKHQYQGKKLDWYQLMLELGDVLWYIQLICAASNGDFDLWDIILANMVKLNQRYPHGFNPEDAAKKRDERK